MMQSQVARTRAGRGAVSVLCFGLCLCLVLFLPSCRNRGEDFSDYARGNAYREAPPLREAVEIDLPGAHFVSACGSLVLLRDGAGYVVYHLGENRVVFRGGADEPVTLGETDCYAAGYFLAGSGSDTRLYAADGTLLDRGEDTPQTSFDLLLFCGKCYRAAPDGTIAYAFDHSPFAPLPALDEMQAGYYYRLGEREVLVYDDALRPVASFAAPSDAASMTAGVLNSGDVLVQYAMEESAGGDSYTFRTEGAEYTLKSFLLRAASNEAESVRLDVLVHAVLPRDRRDRPFDAFGIGEKPENLAQVSEIRSQRLDGAENARRWVVLDNDGHKSKTLARLIPGQNGALPVLVAQNRWTVGNTNGQTFLVGESGQVIGEVTDAQWAGGACLAARGKLYNLSLNAVLDYASEGLALHRLTRRGALFVRGDGTPVYYVNGSRNELAGARVGTVWTRCFAVEKNGHCTLYGDDGVALLETDNMPLLRAGDMGSLLFEADGRFYRVAA